jgi:hypothetical protein
MTAEAQRLSGPQLYALVLSDIATAMAINTYDPAYALSVSPEDYYPGSVKAQWLEQRDDRALRLRVVPLATAGLGSLQALPAAEIVRRAVGYGIPLTLELAEEITAYLEAKSARARTYDRS